MGAWNDVIQRRREAPVTAPAPWTRPSSTRTCSPHGAPTRRRSERSGAMITRAEDGKVRSLSPRGLACCGLRRDFSWHVQAFRGAVTSVKIDTTPGDIAKFSWGLVKVKFQCWPLQKRLSSCACQGLASLRRVLCFVLVPVNR